LRLKQSHFAKNNSPNNGHNNKLEGNDMRKVLIGGLCASLIAGLTACNDKPADVKTPETAKLL